MGFFWPMILGLLVLTPVLVWAYRVGLQHRSESHAMHTDATLLAAMSKRSRGWRQHLTATLAFLAVTVGVIAAARPTWPVPVPEDTAGVVIAIEASRSMYYGDIPPSRMEATKKASKELVNRLHPDIKLGLATFSDSGVLDVPLTTDRQKVLDGIENLEVGTGYSYTFGLLQALEALPKKAPNGGSPGAVVLFSHGHDRSGNDPMKIAEELRKRGIKVFSVGVGTHSYNFNEETIKKIADITGGKYYPVFNANDLNLARDGLAKIVGWKFKPDEVTAIAALISALALFASLALAALGRRVI